MPSFSSRSSTVEDRRQRLHDGCRDGGVDKEDEARDWAVAQQQDDHDGARRENHRHSRNAPRIGRRRLRVSSTLRLNAPPDVGALDHHGGDRHRPTAAAGKKAERSGFIEIAMAKYWMHPSSSSIQKLGACSRRSIGSHSGLRPPIACKAPQVMQIAVATLQMRWIDPAEQTRGSARR